MVQTLNPISKPSWSKPLNPKHAKSQPQASFPIRWVPRGLSHSRSLAHTLSRLSLSLYRLARLVSSSPSLPRPPHLRTRTRTQSGYFGPAGGKATACPAGSYCAAASTSPTDCPSGTTSPALSTDVSACVVLAGFYGTLQGTFACPLNTNSPTGSLDSTDCIPNAGFFGSLGSQPQLCDEVRLEPPLPPPRRSTLASSYCLSMRMRACVRVCVCRDHASSLCVCVQGSC